MKNLSKAVLNAILISIAASCCKYGFQFIELTNETPNDIKFKAIFKDEDNSEYNLGFEKINILTNVYNEDNNLIVDPQTVTFLENHPSKKCIFITFYKEDKQIKNIDSINLKLSYNDLEKSNWKIIYN